MERRAFLAAAAASPVGLLSAQAATYEGLPDDVGAALARFRNSIPSNFDRDYVEHVIVPFFLTSIYEGERPALPMIDVTLTKENALPADLQSLAADTRGGRHGFPPRARGAWREQPAKEDLFLGGHTGSLPPDVPGQSGSVL